MFFLNASRNWGDAIFRSAGNFARQTSFEGKARCSGKGETCKSRVAAANRRFGAQWTRPGMNCRFIALLDTDDPLVTKADSGGLRAALQQFADCLAGRRNIVHRKPSEALRFFTIDFDEIRPSGKSRGQGWATGVQECKAAGGL